MFESGFPKHWSTIKKLMWLYRASGATAAVIKTVKSAIVHITDALAKPLIKCEVTLEPIQSGSGDPSPENVRPITGHTGGDVVRTGKNLLANGIIPSSNLNPFTFSASQFFKAETYTLSFQSTTATNWRYFVRGFDPNGNILPDGFMTGSGMTFRSDFNGYLSGANITNLSRQITLNKDCNLVFGLVLGDITDQTTITGSQLELGSTASTYEPYTGTTYTISWQTEAGTVYYGTIDVVSGKLKSAPYYASYNGETLTGHWISDRDVYAPDTMPTIGSQVVNDGGTLIEYQLTPQEITALLGENNIWADTGSDVEVVYKASAS